ncbi:MAG: M23 family metallopeptidase [Bacteroidota bacterium]
MAIYKEPFDKKLRGDEFGNMASYRKHPHRGQDWHPAEKTVIPAVTDGKVSQIFWSDVLGHVVEILGTDGVYVQYCHLADKPKSIKAGDEVKLGQPVGRVGGGKNTPSGSASTGAHLHMGMSKQKNGHLAPYDKLIDPIKWITSHLTAPAPKAAALATDGGAGSSPAKAE